ncbi:MAG: glycosyltransferase family 2 protein [Chiayiivirga sp.]|jgi:glycosyltransferase involved in cell wall biosynthesis|uniref:glycosyltransferase family 2 protein n=1 Tax=Chiayiivirga sp. TaxID=2041042 RepID=UPI0025B93453|nr:glycosyltransferase family 2 protein [Chiayiivirga sp.]MCI1711904.1 glycosyltransferase family 2 protein [Chiayiivirga sp.]MCI1729510.1 glycosyltransferase family 2 protein [Chiayiivirga sp.]
MDPHCTLDVVVPAYNESEGLREFHARLAPVFDGLGATVCRVIYVDDGSRDDTWAVIEALIAADPRAAGLKLARNFGKELALTAGLDHADADAVVVIDADLQDPPELIPEFVAKWREGYDAVFGTRLERDGETWFKRFTAAAFYRVMDWLSSTPIPRDTGDFRLLSRRAVEALRGLRERQRFMKGLFAWVGLRQVALPYHRDPRHAGSSKFNYWKLWNFALEGITSFSTAPLRIATYVGVFTAVVAFGAGAWIVLKTLLWGDPVAGYPSLMAVILFLGGLQLMALGIMGEYLGRLYMESKARPLYLIDQWHPRRAADELRVPVVHSPGNTTVRRG